MPYLGNLFAAPSIAAAARTSAVVRSLGLYLRPRLSLAWVPLTAQFWGEGTAIVLQPIDYAW